MPAIFIQVKQRVVAGPKQAYVIDEASVNFFPKGKAASKPESSHASKTREETPSRVDIPQTPANFNEGAASTIYYFFFVWLLLHRVQGYRT